MNKVAVPQFSNQINSLPTLPTAPNQASTVSWPILVPLSYHVYSDPSLTWSFDFSSGPRVDALPIHIDQMVRQSQGQLDTASEKQKWS